MDFGLQGRKAIVCASSKGLGLACALALSREGVKVFINGRTAQSLDEAAQSLRSATGGEVVTVQADITGDDGALETGEGQLAQDTQRHLRTDAGDLLHQQAEEVALLLGGEAGADHGGRRGGVVRICRARVS